MPNPGEHQPAIDRMEYLANSQATQQSSMFAALSQEGYGGANAPVGIDNPESSTIAIGKAVAMIICHYAVKYRESSKESVISRMALPLQAVYFSAGGSEDSTSVKEIIYTFIKRAGKWDKLTQSGGFGDGSIFGRKLQKVIDGTVGGDSGEKRYVFAVAVLATFAARWASGETKVLNGLYAYTRIYTYLNTYYKQYGDDANPNMAPMNINEATFSWLLNDNHKNLFLEIENTSDKTSAHEYTMFGYEDLTEIFQEPINPQLMKDAELQAYTLRGELHYDEWWWYHTPYCEDKYVPVTNPNGKVTGYNNIGPTSFPCIDQSRNIIPITGTLFERTFVEAPPVSGTYDGVSSSFITAKTREDYPSDAFFGVSDAETYVSAGDNRWITSVPSYPGSITAGSYIHDTSHYEPYYFIDNHESAGGKPFPGWGCQFPQGAGYCTNGYFGNNAYYPTELQCTGAGFEWFSWRSTCLHPAPPSPHPFPGQYGEFGMFGFTRDMSLRHSLIREDADPSLNYWEDLSSWEWTGFVMAPLMFTPERIEGSYKNWLSNPFYSAGNLGRRAFTFSPNPTAGVRAGTVGPPQAGGGVPVTSDTFNNEGGPFVYGQVYAENKTKKQRASVNIFPGWAYRYTQDPYGTYDLHRTGGWNFPLITMTAYGVGYADPEDSFYTQQPQVEFHGTKISNNYNADGNRTYLYVGERECWIQGTGINPTTNEPWKECTPGNNVGSGIYAYDPMQPQPDPFHYNQELIVPHKFFGMGDGCLDAPVKTTYGMNAGCRYSFHEIDIEKITHRHLKHLTGEFAGLSAEEYYSDNIIGQWGDNYWDEFVTGWINTGDYAGETVHCLHLRTGVSSVAGSNKTVKYYYLGTGIGDVHPNFPYKGVDCLTNFGPLAPYPNLSKCCDLFDPPFNGPTTTTTTTTTPSPTTTTTCDPSDPDCDPGGSASTTTTTSEDPSMLNCDDGIPLSCPDGKVPDAMGYYPSNGVCSWEQCISVACEVDDECYGSSENVSWDSGIWPSELGWVEQKMKQANENPPRYWRGPYASTNFCFMYPNAADALSGQFPVSQGLEITGFPATVDFAVKVEEWIVRDWISGGYINEDGEITWDKVIPLPAPEFKDENKDHDWSNLVDEMYVPKSQAYLGTHEMDGATILQWPEANGRNIETYETNCSFDRGNKEAGISTYRYGTDVENAIYENYKVTYGGFHRYTGYSFPITSSYAKPTYDLKSHLHDYSSITSALQVGNKLFYECSSYSDLDVAQDPIYFMNMVSNENYSKEHIKGLGGGCHDAITGGAHPEGIYGDTWIGLKSKSLFTEYTSNGLKYGSLVAGNLDDWIDCTGLMSGCGFDEATIREDMGPCLSDDDNMYYCYHAAESECGFGKTDGTYQAEARFCDSRVWLFNLSPSKIDVHVRAPDYLSGYYTDTSSYYDMSMGYNPTSECDILAYDSPDTATIKFSITGTDTIVRFYDDEDLGEREAAFANPNNKQLDIFKRDWADGRTINFEKIVYEKEGFLFEKEELTGTWEMGKDSKGVTTGYETVYQYGKRLLSEEGTKVRVSGYRETSKVKLRITGLSLGAYGAIPYDQYFAMESSGNCMVTGSLRYNYQREASIYSEGIVLEDVSDDPLRDVLNYPHYASEVIKRPGTLLPTGAINFDEYIPSEAPVNKHIWPAPSKMVVRRQEFMTAGSGHNNYMEVLRGDPYYYNRYIWPTLSDMATWNGGALSWEGMPTMDKDVYKASNLMICAAAGQPYADDLNGEFIQRNYAVKQHKGFYDGVVLDPTINREWVIDLPTQFSYQPNHAYLVPQGTSISDINLGIIPAAKHTLEPPGGGDGKVVGILT